MACVIKKSISNILVPLDGSKNSVKGLKMAITLAKSCGAEITGMHSIYARQYSEFSSSRAADELSPNDETKKFMKEARLLTEQNGIVFKEEIMHGEVGYNIIKLAHKKPRFDMIVIGSRGRGSAKQMFFGSVSNYVIHTSKIPVVVIN